MPSSCSLPWPPPGDTTQHLAQLQSLCLPRFPGVAQSYCIIWKAFSTSHHILWGSLASVLSTAVAFKLWGHSVPSLLKFVGCSWIMVVVSTRLKSKHQSYLTYFSLFKQWPSNLNMHLDSLWNSGKIQTNKHHPGPAEPKWPEKNSSLRSIKKKLPPEDLKWPVVTWLLTISREQWFSHWSALRDPQ